MISFKFNSHIILFINFFFYIFDFLSWNNTENLCCNRNFWVYGQKKRWNDEIVVAYGKFFVWRYVTIRLFCTEGLGWGEIGDVCGEGYIISV